MTEITYTNKDGLTPAEGTKSLDWTNRNGVSDSPFNYHQDGAAEGDGYAHGGYPEITGESSPYTDTSYKTGDDPDFFDNGNTFDVITTDDGGSDDGGSDDDDTGKSLTISGTFVNDETVKGPAVSDEDFAILVDNDCKLVNVNYNGTVHKATVSYSASDGGIIDFYFDIDDNMGTYLWICAEDGSEDTTRYLQAAKESGTVGEEEFTISIDIENFTEEGGAGGTDPGR